MAKKKTKKKTKKPKRRKAEMTITEIIRDQLQAELESETFTQYRVAKETNLSQGNVARFLGGADMTGERLTRIARFLGMHRIDIG